ncbi:MAG: hypothetical protein K9H49_11865 [Bacteroidales bacterium]|nr:hypothetical protein [Bacteroidales bacterium]
MKSLAFIVKNLSIRKIPGFPDGIKAYTDFAPNINIIAGPNASGKSSTARIIKQLLWPNNTDGVFAESSAEIANENWDVKIDSKSVKIQRQGIDDKFPGIPAFETSKRYNLALHELVKDEDEDIAIEILRQSSGGYNLDKAQNNLSYSKKIKDKGAKEYKEYFEAKNKQNSINQLQKDLLKEEEKLAILNEQFEKAKEGFSLKDIYQKLIDYLHSKIKYTTASEIFRSFPKEMDNLSGKEYEDIEELQNEIENADKAIEKAKIKIKACETRISELKLPGEGISDTFLNELSERIEKIGEFERREKEADLKIEESITRELEAIKNIDESLNPEDWLGLNIRKVNELDQFLQDAHKTISEKQFLEAEIEALKKELTENPPKTDLLNEGIRSLSLWLEEKNSFSGPSRWPTLALSVAGIITALVTLKVGLAGLSGIALIILFTFLAYKKSSVEKENGIRKKDYEKTKLSQPEAWSAKGVTDKLEELLSDLNEAKWQAAIAQKINNYSSELENLKPRLNKINDRYSEWKNDLKAMPELPSIDLKNYTELYWFIDRVNKWQVAHTTYLRALTEKNQLTKNLSEELEKLNRLFQPYNSKIAEDSIGAKSMLNSLRESENIRREANKESGHLKTQMDDYEKQKDAALKKAEKIYTNLNIPVGDIGGVKHLLMSLDDYKKSKEAFREAEILMKANGNLIKTHSLFDKNKSILETLSIDQAEARLKEFEEDADRYESLNKEITEIETNIRNAKGSHSLEDALKRQEEALLNLEQLYENNLSAITGDLLISHLKERARKYNQPQVLIRANELFTSITSGRYRLQIDDKKTISLRAYDNVLNLGQDLSELSTGTRIQLLLSVRIAFIEMQEGMIKLPILADELLANSDDIRAKAIIEALIKISKEGRQVFYFTAQDDEVSKWKYYLDKDKEIKFNIFKLNGRENESGNQKSALPEFKEFEIIQNITPPKNTSHKDYGSIIGVPPFNLLSGNLEQIHIWHLTTDNELIYNCLKKGVQSWGQLINYIDNSGKIEGMDEAARTMLREKILLIERFLELYRRGRPKPIDREILEKSEAVSGNFIDEVNAKLIALDGNPVKLLTALKNGEVNKFRMNKAEELEKYLRDEEYINDYEVLDKNEILIQLNAFLSGLELKDIEAESVINKLLNPEF